MDSDRRTAEASLTLGTTVMTESLDLPTRSVLVCDLLLALLFVSVLLTLKQTIKIVCHVRFAMAWIPPNPHSPAVTPENKARASWLLLNTSAYLGNPQSVR